MSNAESKQVNWEDIKRAALDSNQIKSRVDLGKYTAEVFEEVGVGLYVIGELLGSNGSGNHSPFGHGDDSVVAVSMLLRIGGQLVSATTDMTVDGRHYAASALVRQLVEVEYLAWAFEAKDAEAGRWLRSTHEERKEFFTPAKLRAAANKHFRGIDYSYHCELGGHPTPLSWLLLNDDEVMPQLALSDCLGHSGRIWDHIFRWAKENPKGNFVFSKAEEMVEHYMHWKSIDLLTKLPIPPDKFPDGW